MISAHVIVSEFRFRGTNGATDEFVELYNRTNQTRDITGWTLVSGNAPLHMISGSLPARSHYLITGRYFSPNLKVTPTVTPDG